MNPSLSTWTPTTLTAVSGVVFVLVLLLAGWVVGRSRHPPEPHGEKPHDEPPDR